MDTHLAENGENHEDDQQKLPQSSPKSAMASPPSASSSPSHEFSFTISLHSSSTNVPDKTKSMQSFAVDLSPADEIFFHGHLLPLHLLSHLPVSPRSSSNSLDSFTLPIRELLDEQRTTKDVSSSISGDTTPAAAATTNTNNETKGRTKSKSFSILRLTKWRKGCEIKEQGDKEKAKRKMRFDMRNVLKRYMRLVRPLFFFKWRRENIQLHREPYSFSGNLTMKNKQELRGRRGEFSAPASMRTSPTNSGLLLATSTLPSSTNDSTMEELQAAIQAAIAHCKNSSAVEEKLKS